MYPDSRESPAFGGKAMTGYARPVAKNEAAAALDLKAP
jgi:hypothetical protein